MKNANAKGSHPDLTPRAISLLILVADNTQRDGEAISQYFVPKPKPMWSETMRRYVDVGGSGDAASFRALVRRGLVEPVRRGGDYCFATTKDGEAIAEVFAAMPAYGGK